MAREPEEVFFHFGHRVGFERAWIILKEDEWPERVSNMLGGGTEEELFGENYEAAKEGKSPEEHDEFMMNITDLIDRVMNPAPNPSDPITQLAEAMRRREQEKKT